MIMGCYRYEGENPELGCWKVISEFIREESLHDKYGFRHFGFNNPMPTENNTEYGYEMWIAIPEGLTVPKPLWRMEFDGGLYMAITTSIGMISEHSLLLYDLVNGHDQYSHDTSRRWLEEFADFKFFDDLTGGLNKQIDLLAPVTPFDQRDEARLKY